MKAYTTLLFDLDDTLLDFVESENRGLNYIYHKYCKDFGIQLQQMTEAYHPINKKMWASVDSGARTPTQIAFPI